MDYIEKHGRRKAFMGDTPGKDSRTGRKVIERMRKEGRVRGKEIN